MLRDLPSRDTLYKTARFPPVRALTMLQRCTECGSTLRIPEQHIGAKIRCPSCKEVFRSEIDATTTVVSQGLPAEETKKRRFPPPVTIAAATFAILLLMALGFFVIRDGDEAESTPIDVDSQFIAAAVGQLSREWEGATVRDFEDSAWAAEEGYDFSTLDGDGEGLARRGFSDDGTMGVTLTGAPHVSIAALSYVLPNRDIHAADAVRDHFADFLKTALPYWPDANLWLQQSWQNVDAEPMSVIELDGFRVALSYVAEPVSIALGVQAIDPELPANVEARASKLVTTGSYSDWIAAPEKERNFAGWLWSISKHREFDYEEKAHVILGVLYRNSVDEVYAEGELPVSVSEVLASMQVLSSAKWIAQLKEEVASTN